MSQTFPAPVTLLADTVHFKEFYGGYTGTCGETALTAALICAERLGQGAETHDAAVALMLSVTSEMRAAGWADANGASTLWSLAQEAAKKRGAQISLEWDYAEPFLHDWHSVLLANAGIKPIVLQVGMAMNLVGQDGTGHAEAGVHYHFICVVGKCADGYIVMDGDNYLIEQELSIYSYATLQAADICGLLMLDVVPAPAPKPAPAPTPAPTPAPAPAPAPSPVAADAAKMNALFGKTVAWVGNEALKWAVSDFTNAAKTLKSLGFEGMCVKRADGTNKWYSSTAQIAAEKAAVEAEGIKYVPFTYCYGPKFGDGNLDGECAILKELASVAGVVQADMETEWNGNVAAAQRFASNMKPMTEPLSITIVADPAQQNWDGVMAALAPVCNAWVPQYYDTWLSQQPLPAVATVVQPGVDITNEYGANDPVAIAAKSSNSVFVWEYETVLQNPALATQIVARSSKGLPMNPTFFTANSDGSFTAIATGKKVQKGFLTWYQANAGLFRLGLPLDNEYTIPGKGTATIQIFERGALVWDTARAYDDPIGVGADSIYFAHINSGEVLKFILALAPAPAAAPAGGGPAGEAVSAPSENPAPAPTSSNELLSLKAEVTALQGQLSTLHSALAGVRQVLDPISSADAQLVDAMKKAGF